MNDDLRPTSEPRRGSGFGFRKLHDSGAAPVSPDLKATAHVDEDKILEEFGPPSTAWPVPEDRSVRAKIVGLLPAFTKGHRPHPTKLKLILLAVALLLVGGAGAASYLILTRYSTPVAHFTAPVIKPKPKPPALVPSTLTGLMVDPSINNLPVTAVMIENSIDDRPQSGLDQAGVVFEALAEGGVTRFMALF